MIMAINLLPIAPLDGARAWQLPKLWRARRGKKYTAKAKDSKPPAPKKARPVSESDAQKLRLVRDKDGDFRFENDDEDA
jgi:membrane-associated protease RseP (regulator of RpoE activity)